MLELRPTCEHCNKALPPGSIEARICSYECTFCVGCVEHVLNNVCPNCGGAFESDLLGRPIIGRATIILAKIRLAQRSNTGRLISPRINHSQPL